MESFERIIIPWKSLDIAAKLSLLNACGDPGYISNESADLMWEDKWKELTLKLWNNVNDYKKLPKWPQLDLNPEQLSS